MNLFGVCAAQTVLDDFQWNGLKITLTFIRCDVNDLYSLTIFFPFSFSLDERFNKKNVKNPN